jgi:hypothetical protein
MGDSFKIVISASRRTDIPAFYMPDFMEQIDRGYFEVVNPFNQKKVRIPSSPEHVQAIVFWSKNFELFLEKAYGSRLSGMGYHLFFNFTINSEARLLEPEVPPLSQRLTQLERLCRQFDPRCVTWRFDPICHFRLEDRKIQDNFEDFESIAEAAAQCGVTRCTTSFMDHYPKISNRMKRKPGIAFVDIPLAEKVFCICNMEKILKKRNIGLSLCCEAPLLHALPEPTTVGAGACIDGRLLMEIYGGRLHLKRDGGQRVKAGCGCSVSVDIGNYRTQPCGHNCVYCYANPKSAT